MQVAIPITSALIGAIAAAILAQYLRRSRPALIVDELSRSADIAPQSTGAVLNSDLVSACKENEFISAQTFLDAEEGASEKKYIAALHSALDQAELAIEGLPAVTEVARSLNDCLQRDDYASFQSVFGRESARVWLSLLGSYVRGKFAYHEPGPVPLNYDPQLSAPVDESSASTDDDQDISTVLKVPSLAEYEQVRTEFSEEARCIEYSHPAWAEKIVQDEDGDFLIPKAGPVNLVFPWRKYAGPAQLLRVRAFAMRTAVAFASYFRADLQQISNFLLTVEQENRPVLEGLQRRLRDELLEYERVIIKGFIANRGGSPVTVTNSGRLFVGLAGYAFTDDDRTLRSLTGDQQIDMFIGADRGEGEPNFRSSITVEAGAVARFVAASKKRIQDLPDPAVLVKALTGGERMCYLGTMVVSQGNRVVDQQRSRSQFSATYTAPQPFRDSASEIEVPPRQGVFKGASSRKTI